MAGVSFEMQGEFWPGVEGLAADCTGVGARPVSQVGLLMFLQVLVLLKA